MGRERVPLVESPDHQLREASLREGEGTEVEAVEVEDMTRSVVEFAISRDM